MSYKVEEFREKIEALPREEIIQLIREQDPELVKQIKRIEWVFANKLTHLTWNDGTPIEGREFTKQELALIVDPPSVPSKDLYNMGLTMEQQEQIHTAQDPVLWAKRFLNATPRVYQILMLRYPSNRKVLRAGRRLGKTYTMAIMILHYAFTNKNGRILVMAPMKPMVGLIYEEIMKLAKESDSVNDSITRAVTSPQYEIHLSNGSTIRFFKTGLRSGGKSDVARGQEAHLIILDELDYMGPEDLDALYAMLQKTDDNQPDKILVGASTPTGRRERFWQWSRGVTADGKPAPPSSRFKEFWFPSYANPHFTKEVEEEMRAQYNEMAYRHEIEADWGEDAEGVYPRRFVDAAFVVGDEEKGEDPNGWPYVDQRTSARSFHLIGVDWDKYGAGPNICVLEVCQDDYEEERFQGKIRVAYREEIPRNEYVLTQAVDRIIDLNKAFNPKYIYVDKGFGEVQVELLHKYGVENPASGLRKKVRGVSFAETIEIRDPASKQVGKKEMKPFMVENLRGILEKNQLLIPAHDQELYLQLISYVVVRTTAAGRPVFEASGSQVDHAHDALILACLAFTQNYGELMRVRLARHSRSISNKLLFPMKEPSDKDVKANQTLQTVKVTDDSDDDSGEGTLRRRPGIPRRSQRRPSSPIVRKKF